MAADWPGMDAAERGETAVTKMTSISHRTIR